MRLRTTLLLLTWSSLSFAGPLADPGNLQLRHDLQLLNDAGIIDIPLTAWPLSLPDVHASLDSIPRTTSPESEAALARVRHWLGAELDIGVPWFQLTAAGAVEPRFVRSFEATPRDEGEFGASVEYMGERLAFRLAATAVANPFDDDEVRPDGSWIGMTFGNWMVTAGWQDRWWGPGRDASLILSNNARPAPGIMLQRNLSEPFESRWLSWLGPWTLTTFMSHLDDDRAVDDALLFGVRGSFRPPGTGLEIGVSRTAQWCGDDRPCDLDVFGDLLLGKDNRGINVDPEDEPGNQLGGFDVRWTLPRSVPAALYLQWIGEDGRGGGGAIGSWLRQVGVEHWGAIGSVSHRTHFEVSDSMCREGGSGFSFRKPDCAYEHPIFETGYRYRNRAIGAPGDGDTLSYSLGSTLVQSGGQTWNISLRYMKLNRIGAAQPRHTLSSTPQELTDFQVTYSVDTRRGNIFAGLGYARLEDSATQSTDSDVSAFVQWRSR